MDLSPIIGDLAISSFAGFSVGFFSKKFLKIIAFILGGYLASLMYLSSKGYLVINWSMLGESIDGIFSKILGLNLSVGLMGAGSVAGFMIGWKSG